MHGINANYGSNLPPLNAIPTRDTSRSRSVVRRMEDEETDASPVSITNAISEWISKTMLFHLCGFSFRCILLIWVSRVLATEYHDAMDECDPQDSDCKLARKACFGLWYYLLGVSIRIGSPTMVARRYASRMVPPITTANIVMKSIGNRRDFPLKRKRR